jgi:hypothetical protein
MTDWKVNSYFYLAMLPSELSQKTQPTNSVSMNLLYFLFGKNYTKHVIFEVFTAVTMKNAETSVHTRSTRRHIPEQGILYNKHILQSACSLKILGHLILIMQFDYLFSPSGKMQYIHNSFHLPYIFFGGENGGSDFLRETAIR